MWYEILPGLAIMFAGIVLPGIATARIQKYCNGGKEKRITPTPWHWYLMERDRRVSASGKYFESRGLDGIK